MSKNTPRTKIGSVLQGLVDANRLKYSRSAFRPLNSPSTWEKDGVDHINISVSDALTPLGKAASPGRYRKFIHSKFGKFNSVESFRLWLRSDNHDDRARHAVGHALRNLSRDLKKSNVLNQDAIVMDAYFQSILQHPSILELFLNSDLPFDSYFLNTKGVLERSPAAEWLIPGLTEIRKAIQEDRLPDFSFMMTKKVAPENLFDHLNIKVVEEEKPPVAPKASKQPKAETQPKNGEQPKAKKAKAKKQPAAPKEPTPGRRQAYPISHLFNEDTQEFEKILERDQFFLDIEPKAMVIKDRKFGIQPLLANTPIPLIYLSNANETHEGEIIHTLNDGKPVAVTFDENDPNKEGTARAILQDTSQPSSLNVSTVYLEPTESMRLKLSEESLELTRLNIGVRVPGRIDGLPTTFYRVMPFHAVRSANGGTPYFAEEAKELAKESGIEITPKHRMILQIVLNSIVAANTVNVVGEVSVVGFTTLSQAELDAVIGTDEDPSFYIKNETEYLTHCNVVGYTLSIERGLPLAFVREVAKEADAGDVASGITEGDIKDLINETNERIDGVDRIVEETAGVIDQVAENLSVETQARVDNTDGPTIDSSDKPGDDTQADK